MSSDIHKILSAGLVQSHDRIKPDTKNIIKRVIGCGIGSLGYHSRRCTDCHAILYTPNSCHLPYCTKCQFSKRQKWIEEKRKEILPADYFQLVFTIPNIFTSFMLKYKYSGCNILFSSSAETLQTFVKNLGIKERGRDDFLGGFMSVLHTWNQELLPHFHIHVLIPGVFIDSSGSIMYVKNRKFLFHVKHLSKVFRMIFIKKLREFIFGNDFISPIERQEIEILARKSLKKEWVVYAKETADATTNVVEYLAAYTHRVGLSKAKISFNEPSNKISLTVVDRKTKKVRRVSLDPVSFLRRFSYHILPKGLRRIRYYGHLSNLKKRDTLALFSIEKEKQDIKNKVAEAIELNKKRCPYCLGLNVEFKDIVFGFDIPCPSNVPPPGLMSKISPIKLKIPLEKINIHETLFTESHNITEGATYYDSS